jgi:membrane protein implicated in regulation of membrane protease activity
MSPGAIWVLAGLVVAALELMAPGFFLIWIGLAALGTGAATELVNLGREAQIAMFATLTVVLIGAIGLRLRRRAPVDLVNAPASNLIGQTCRAVTFEGPEGRVSLGDGTWYARLVSGGPPAAGEPLRVVGLDGTVLLVSKA